MSTIGVDIEGSGVIGAYFCSEVPSRVDEPCVQDWILVVLVNRSGFFTNLEEKMSRAEIIRQLSKKGIKVINRKYIEECYTFELLAVFKQLPVNDQNFKSIPLDRSYQNAVK